MIHRMAHRPDGHKNNEIPFHLPQLFAPLHKTKLHVGNGPKSAQHLHIIYAREDKDALLELKKQLIPLERSRQIALWYDGEMVPGIERIEEVLGVALLMAVVPPHAFIGILRIATIQSASASPTLRNSGRQCFRSAPQSNTILHFAQVCCIFVKNNTCRRYKFKRK